jgi:hypothetical protein
MDSLACVSVDVEKIVFSELLLHVTTHCCEERTEPRTSDLDPRPRPTDSAASTVNRDGSTAVWFKEESTSYPSSHFYGLNESYQFSSAQLSTAQLRSSDRAGR